jgi:hypothetical protein
VSSGTNSRSTTGNGRNQHGDAEHEPGDRDRTHPGDGLTPGAREPTPGGSEGDVGLDLRRRTRVLHGCMVDSLVRSELLAVDDAH